MSRVTAATTQPSRTVSGQPRELWHVPHPSTRSLAAISRARRMAAWIKAGGRAGTAPTQHALFAAMHTCAHLTNAAARAGGKEHARRRWFERWRLIREHLVRQNVGLVYKTLAKFDLSRLDGDALLSDGMYALGRAVDRFDPWRDIRFSTYACNSIIRAMMRRKRRESRYREFYPFQFESDLERPVRSDESEKDLYVERLRLVLRDNAAHLTGLEWSILHRRFLYTQGRQLTFEAIGHDVGLSKERVRQIQNGALQKLRAALAEDPILQ